MAHEQAMLPAQPHRHSKPFSETNVMSPMSQRLAGNYFFVATLIIGTIGWGLALVGQAIVTNKIGNGTVGFLWYAIVIQTGIIAGILLTLWSDTVPIHRVQISILAAMVTVFATIGVNSNIFLGRTSEKIMAAGWLITAVIDTLWILVLTAEDGSPFLVILRHLGPTGDYRPAITTIPNVPANMDAFSYPPLPRNNMSGIASDRGSRPAQYEDGTTRSHIPSAMESEAKRGSAGVWSTYTPPQALGDRGTTTTFPPDTSTAAAAMGNSSTRPGSLASGRGALSQQEERAEALYDYKASKDPHEVSFKQGEVMIVLDRSRNWWEVVKSNGTRGVAPSNYLQLLLP